MWKEKIEPVSLIAANLLVATVLAYSTYVFIQSGIGIKDAKGREVEAITTTVLVFEFLYFYATYEKTTKKKIMLLAVCFLVGVGFTTITLTD